jgi:hypothetical protein
MCLASLVVTGGDARAVSLALEMAKSVSLLPCREVANEIAEDQDY